MYKKDFRHRRRGYESTYCSSISNSFLCCTWNISLKLIFLRMIAKRAYVLLVVVLEALPERLLLLFFLANA